MKRRVRRIELKPNEARYLEEATFLPFLLLESLQKIRWRSEGVGTLDLPAATAEQFRDAFTVQLAKVGFDDAYEPNKEGAILEELIDRFAENSAGRLD